MNAMILAAGLGTRLRPVTSRYAKPAVPFLNIPLLFYSVALLEKAGPTSITVNSHYKSEQIDGLVASLQEHLPRLRGHLHVSREPEAPLGSGGGIRQARSRLESGDFLLANGDEVILPHDPRVIERLMNEHQSHDAIATILVMHHPGVGTRFGGVWARDDGSVAGFGKKGDAFGSGLTGYHYIGLQVMSPRIFAYLPEGASDILYTALTNAIQNGETVRVVAGAFTWFETGNPQDFLLASQEALALLARNDGSEASLFLKELCSRFWRVGTTLLAAPGDTPSGGGLLADPAADIAAGARFVGYNVVGARARVENGALVENAVILPDARVLSTDVIKNTIVV